MSFKNWLLSLLIVISVSFGWIIEAEDSSNSLENQIITEFQQEFDQIVIFAKNNPKPIAYDTLMAFVDEHLMQRWSAELTIRAIVGRELWAKIDTEEQKALIGAYTNTMRRYLYETFLQYDGQLPVAEKVQLNSKANKGWLTTKLVIDNFPDVSVDLKLYFHKNQWVIYDFRFQGISFIKLKTREYRSYIEKEGAFALVKILNDKYQQFINQLEFAE